VLRGGNRDHPGDYLLPLLERNKEEHPFHEEKNAVKLRREKGGVIFFARGAATKPDNPRVEGEGTIKV